MASGVHAHALRLKQKKKQQLLLAGGQQQLGLHINVAVLHITVVLIDGLIDFFILFSIEMEIGSSTRLGWRRF